jgi:hypothetical protein
MQGSLLSPAMYAVDRCDYIVAYYGSRRHE